MLRSSNIYEDLPLREHLINGYGCFSFLKKYNSEQEINIDSNSEAGKSKTYQILVTPVYKNALKIVILSMIMPPT